MRGPLYDAAFSRTARVLIASTTERDPICEVCVPLSIARAMVNSAPWISSNSELASGVDTVVGVDLLPIRPPVALAASIGFPSSTARITAALAVTCPV